MRQTNNFDLLRFLLASTVVLVHSHVLSQENSLAFLSHFLSSEFAIKGFFVVSGYLIFRSYDTAQSVADYFEKRVRRIYPAYAAIILVSVTVGAFITQVSLSEYFSPPLVKYLGANLVFLNFLAPNLPGMFAGNPVEAVNGALWTLKIEVAFYVLVPVFVYLFRRFGTLRIAVLLYLGSVVYLVGMTAAAAHTGRHLFELLARQLPGQLAYFVSGALFYFYDDALRRWLLPATVVSVPLLLLHHPVFDVLLAPICLGFVIAYFATGLRFLGNFGKHGDFSYGIYIIHFPILQLLVWYGAFNANPVLALGAGAMLILGGAFLSWHLVEKPFLKKSSHYVVAASDSPQQIQDAQPPLRGPS